MEENRDFDYVQGKVPRYDKEGNDITGDTLGGGGLHRDDGTFSGMAYDLEKVEKDDDDNTVASVALNNIIADSAAGNNNEALTGILLLMTTLAFGIYIGIKNGNQIKSFYNKIRKWGTKKILHKNVDDETNKDANEEMPNLTSEQCLNQEYMGNMLLINENVQVEGFDIRQHADEYIDCYNKTSVYLTRLINDYNDTSKESTHTFATLYSLLIPFKQSFVFFSDSYKKEFGELPLGYSEWNKTIASLNLEKFLEELRLVLDQEETIFETNVLQMPNNQRYDKESVMKNLRLLLTEDGICA
jgi:hypothetical protein